MAARCKALGEAVRDPLAYLLNRSVFIHEG